MYIIHTLTIEQSQLCVPSHQLVRILHDDELIIVLVKCMFSSRQSSRFMCDDCQGCGNHAAGIGGGGGLYSWAVDLSRQIVLAGLCRSPW